MITILASPKPFVGDALSRQMNAIRSWLRLGDDVEVILYGNSKGTSRAAEKLEVRWIGDIETNEFGTPLFGAIARHAERHASCDLQAYVNCDIILGKDFTGAAKSIPFKQFLMIGQRFDLPSGELTDVMADGWPQHLAEMVKSKKAVLHPPAGSDYFVFKRGLWKGLAGALAIGRAGYDNALIGFCLERSIPVVDATFLVTAVHQHHDYGHVSGGEDEIFAGKEALSNLEAIGSGSRPVLTDATWQLRRGSLRRTASRGDWMRALETHSRFVLKSEMLGEAAKKIGRVLRTARLSRPQDVRPDELFPASIPGRGALPRITFGMIVFNGEPFIEYNLRAIYPYAHQIVVVEGACPSARRISTPEGHSSDGTLETLRRFKAKNDPQGKVSIITAEDEAHPNGFWTEKDEMSMAYARRATGNYLWQIDSDEFYLPRSLETVIDILKKDPSITAASFPVGTFLGDPGYRVGGFLADNLVFHRLFAWKDNYRYITHRPPTVVDEKGRNLRTLNAITVREMARSGIYLYHYELLFPKQVAEKCSYYANAAWTRDLKDAMAWFEECYLGLKRPFRVHMVYEVISWLERFYGSHPPEALRMIEDVRRGRYPDIKLRETADIEKLISSRSYTIKRAALKPLVPLYRGKMSAKRRIREIFRGSFKQ